MFLYQFTKNMRVVLAQLFTAMGLQKPLLVKFLSVQQFPAFLLLGMDMMKLINPTNTT